MAGAKLNKKKGGKAVNPPPRKKQKALPTVEKKSKKEEVISDSDVSEEPEMLENSDAEVQGMDSQSDMSSDGDDDVYANDILQGSDDEGIVCFCCRTSILIIFILLNFSYVFLSFIFRGE